MPLTSNQLSIVRAPTDRCVLVNAGPGTGKTAVLVERFLHLVTDAGLALDDILMVTFTRKAAREMRERLARRLLESGRLKTSLAIETAWVTNFHGLAFRLLRENALLAGFDPASRIQDEVESSAMTAALRREFLNSPLAQEALASEARGDPVPAAVIERLTYSLDNTVKTLDRAKENLLDAAAVARLGGTELKEIGDDDEARAERAAHEFFSRCLPEVAAHYERAKAADALVDFVDLEVRAVQFLESEAGKPLRSRFRAILVDEFQDTNKIQLRILELLAKPALANVMAVGDERQAIYAFRGARVENIRELPERVRSAGGECLVLDLYESFRSYQEILDISVRALPEDSPGGKPLVATAFGSASEDSRARAPVVRTIRLETKEDEADRIATEIAGLVGKPITTVGLGGARVETSLGWGHFAVLMRGVESARAYEDALRARGIPYRTFGGTGFFDRREILDLLAYLRAIADPYDDLALVRVLQNPPFGLSDRSLHALANLELVGTKAESPETDAHENKVIPGFRLKPFDALGRAVEDPAFAESLGLEERTLARLGRLRTFLERCVRRRGTVPVSRLLLDVLVETGYGKLLLVDERSGPLEALRRRKNVERLLRLARRHEERNVYGSLDELVNYLECALEEEVREEEESVEADGRVVNVMTVHQAKGKEWPVVFVAGLTDRSWPMRGWPVDVAFFDEGGAVLRRAVLGHEEDGKIQFDETRLYQRFAAKNVDVREAEERRLLFVAMTRAKNLLVLSGNGDKTAYLDRIAAALPAGEPEADSGGAAQVSASEARASEPAQSSGEVDLRVRVESALAAVSAPLDAPPRKTGTSEVHLSFSQIDIFDTCPLKYKFSFVTPLPGMAHWAAPTRPTDAGSVADLSATELGSVFHAALERWAHEDRPLGELVHDAARDRGWPGLSPGDSRHALIFVENFLASRLGKRKPAPDEVEVPFTLVLEAEGLAVSVNGAIDRLDPEPDGNVVVTDYKTNRGVEPARYALQLSIYRLAVERVLQRRVAGCFAYFVRHPEVVGLVPVATLTPQETELRILEVARRVAVRDFAMTEHPGKETCWRCPFGGTDGFCPEKRLR